MLPNPAIFWRINTDLYAAWRSGYRTKMGARKHTAALAQSQRNIIDSTHLCGALDDCVEHRLHIRRRAADNSEHLRCCRLMFQGFAQFCVALLQFLEQADVFNRDNGLVGEGFEKRDLLV